MVKIMSIIEHRNRSPRILVWLSLNNACVSRGLSYHKLAKNLLISLSILKLDGSSFDIEVSMNATVAGVKLALEEAFGLLAEDDQGEISWSHVWGHFCLCYEGQKLVNDKASIRKYGIKDGDQVFVLMKTIHIHLMSCCCHVLHGEEAYGERCLISNKLQFIQHISVNYRPRKTFQKPSVLGWVKCT